MSKKKHMHEQSLNYRRVETAIQFLSTRFREQPDLDEVARRLHLSPFHFQRIFTEWAGVSPKKFLQYLSTEHLKARLSETANLLEAAELAGLSSQSRVHDLFVTLEAVTPQQYRSGGVSLTIQYGFHDTPFGSCLLAATTRGICALSFVEPGQEGTSLEALQAKWPKAQFSAAPEATRHWVDAIFAPETLQRSGGKIHLYLQGTNFQVRVWEALLKIPLGSVTTYKKIAAMLHQPGAARAVGSAIGANPVAWLIPCHRVIRYEGMVGQYHWGSHRKQAILGWEMAKGA